MLKIKFWKKEESKEPEELKKVVLDQKSLDIGSSIGELNQKFDKLSMAVGQCFISIDKKIPAGPDEHPAALPTVLPGQIPDEQSQPPVPISQRAQPPRAGVL